MGYGDNEYLPYIATLSCPLVWLATSALILDNRRCMTSLSEPRKTKLPRASMNLALRVPCPHIELDDEVWNDMLRLLESPEKIEILVSICQKRLAKLLSRRSMGNLGCNISCTAFLLLRKHWLRYYGWAKWSKKSKKSVYLLVCLVSSTTHVVVEQHWPLVRSSGL